MSTEFAPMGKIDSTSAFDQSFGSLHKTSNMDEAPIIYQVDSIQKSEPEVMTWDSSEVMTKAETTTTSTYAAGTLPVLIPISVDRDIVDLTAREAPLYGMTTRRAVMGLQVDFNQLTVEGAATFLAESAVLNSVSDTHARTVVAVKYAYSTGEVTGPFIAGARSSGYLDALSYQVQRRTAAMAKLLEDKIINGDAATYPVEFNGLIKTITTNTQNKAGAALTISDMRAAIRACEYAGTTPSTTLGGERPNLVVTDYETRDNVKALLTAYLTYPAPGLTLAWGVQAVEFEGVPIMGSRFMPTTANAKRMLFLNMKYIELGVLQDMTYVALAPTYDAVKFTIKWYGCLVNKAEKFMMQIYGLP